MDVFLMWSGERSHKIARDLKEFLEFVVRGPKYFISDDIEGGRLWRVALAGQLELSSFGIACLTSDNLHSHWLHFEAGALSKAVGQAHVIPFLVGPHTTDVDGPLSDFQMILGDEQGVRKLVMLLATQIEGNSPDIVDRGFGFVWPDFEQKLMSSLSVAGTSASEPVRSESALIQEILDRVRRIETRAENQQSTSVKPPDRPSLSLDDGLVRRIKSAVDALIEEFSGETTNSTMDTAIEKWREALAKDSLTGEELLEIYREARSLQNFLSR